MKLYELYIILKPSLTEGEVNVFSSKVGEFLTKKDFNIGSVSVKPNERITYIIKHQRQAHILTFDISGGDDSVFPEELEQDFRRDENVLRFLVFSKSEKMVIKRAKQISVLDQLRRERKFSPAVQEEITAPVESREPKADIAEIDKKLEEILK